MKLLYKKFNGSFNTLVIDDKDGLYVLSFANYIAMMYKPNEVFIYDGKLENNVISSLSNRKC